MRVHCRGLRPWPLGQLASPRPAASIPAVRKYLKFPEATVLSCFLALHTWRPLPVTAPCLVHILPSL